MDKDNLIAPTYEHNAQYIPGKETIALHSPPVLPPIPNQNKLVMLGPTNSLTDCPFCYTTVKTAIKHTATSRTHIASILYAFCCCCCCIPFCSNSAQNTDHYCPQCSRFLGTYEK